MKDDRVYLLHMADCIARIEEYTCDGEAGFFRDQKTQDSVVRNLQTMTESSIRLSQTLKDSHPDIDRAAIKRFRNVVVHDYLGLNMTRVWDIVINDLPSLKRKIADLLNQITTST